VYVGNLPFNVKSQDLREFFQKNGHVVSAQIIYNSQPTKPAGYGFVTFYSKEEAEVAIETFNGQVNIFYPFTRFILFFFF
jgi:RNA recognition motif-containing protein